MREFQTSVIKQFHVKPLCDPAQEIDKRISFLVRYALAAESSGFVLGISGGQDSALAGKLAQMAVERLRAHGIGARFTAMRLPYRMQFDEHHAQKILEFIQPDERITFDITGSVDQAVAEYQRASGKKMSDFLKGNVKARMRMIAQYAVAAERDALVVGTDHAAEAVTGFFTKFGDGGADVLPLAGLTKRQGVSLLGHFDAPAFLRTKKPTADLLDHHPGESDEESLGVKYEHIDNFLEGQEVSQETTQTLYKHYSGTQHKRHLPVTPFDTWWKEPLLRNQNDSH